MSAAGAPDGVVPPAAGTRGPGTPRFSVVVPTFDRGAAILPTLRSVATQTETSWELLVVSDGSTDDTDDVVAGFARDEPRCLLLRTPRHGAPGGPRNAGLRAARGRYVAYLDHDDAYAPEHLETLGALLDDGAPWAFTGAERVAADGTPGAATTDLDLVWHPELQLAGPVVEPSRVAHRRGLAEELGGWWENPRGLEDWDLWVRLADAGHRPATSTRRTVRLLDDAGTRRHRMGWSCTQVLARTGDAGAAERAVSALQDDARAAETARAARTDLVAWYARITTDDAVVLPREGRPDVDALLAATLRDAPRPWRDVAVVPAGAGAALVRTLPCARRNHARRVVRLAARTQPAQLRVVRDAVAAAA